MPLPIATGAVGIIGMAVLTGWTGVLASASTFPFRSVAQFDYSVVPLFTFVALLLFTCGVGDELFEALRRWLGHTPGGLGVAVSGGSAALGTIDATGMATSVLMAKVAYPQMRAQGYRNTLAFGVITSSGPLGGIIPPSIMLVIYAILAEQSIGRCLLAGIIPGFLLALLFAAYVVIRALLDPTIAPRSTPATWIQRFTGLTYIAPIVVIFLVICGGIYFGIFTASEAGGVAALISFFVVLAMRRLTRARLLEVTLETVRLTCLIVVFLIGITFFTRFLGFSGVTRALVEFALSFPSPILSLLLIIVVCFIMGMFITPMAIMFVTVPVFVPAVIAMGYDPIWFGVIIVTTCIMALLTPPVAGNVFVVQGLVGQAEIALHRAYMAVLPFVVCYFVGLVIFILFPEIVTFLPSKMVGG